MQRRHSYQRFGHKINAQLSLSARLVTELAKEAAVQIKSVGSNMSAGFLILIEECVEGAK